MTRRTLKTELEALTLALSTNAIIQADLSAQKIFDDFSEALSYSRMHKRKRYLIWGLLIGRSADSFTVFFLVHKHVTCIGNDTFNNRIKTIINPRTPLTRDVTIISELHIVRDLRNNLFHNSGIHFTDQELQDFVFKTIKCIQQLLMDL
jgi:hypothetical protein